MVKLGTNNVIVTDEMGTVFFLIFNYELKIRIFNNN